MTDNQQAARELEERDRDSHEWTLRNNGYEDIADLIALLRSQAREWLPIESAPKDGTYVLLFDEQRDGQYLHASWRHGNWWTRPTLSGRSITWKDATHWQPLPAPPRPTQERQAHE